MQNRLDSTPDRRLDDIARERIGRRHTRVSDRNASACGKPQPRNCGETVSQESAILICGGSHYPKRKSEFREMIRGEIHEPDGA